jgi:hypothetical protein
MEGSETITESCRQCHCAIDRPVPARWIQKYPELAGLCPDCVVDWIAKQPYAD